MVWQHSLVYTSKVSTTRSWSVLALTSQACGFRCWPKHSTTSKGVLSPLPHSHTHTKADVRTVSTLMSFYKSHDYWARRQRMFYILIFYAIVFWKKKSVYHFHTLKKKTKTKKHNVQPTHNLDAATSPTHWHDAAGNVSANFPLPSITSKWKWRYSCLLALSLCHQNRWFWTTFTHRFQGFCWWLRQIFRTKKLAKVSTMHDPFLITPEQVLQTFLNGKQCICCNTT